MNPRATVGSQCRVGDRYLGRGGSLQVWECIPSSRQFLFLYDAFLLSPHFPLPSQASVVSHSLRYTWSSESHRLSLSISSGRRLMTTLHLPCLGHWVRYGSSVCMQESGVADQVLASDHRTVIQHGLFPVPGSPLQRGLCARHAFSSSGIRAGPHRDRT